MFTSKLSKQEGRFDAEWWGYYRHGATEIEHLQLQAPKNTNKFCKKI